MRFGEDRQQTYLQRQTGSAFQHAPDLMLGSLRGAIRVSKYIQVLSNSHVYTMGHLGHLEGVPQPDP